MFEPKFTITPQLLDNVKRIAVLVADLNSRHFSKLTLVRLEEAARAVSSHSSTSIEGNPLPLTEVRRILRNLPEHLRDSEREVLNYNRALEILDKEIRKGSTRFDLGLILRIQKEVTDGLIGEGNSGTIRHQPVFVHDPRIGKPVYLPPDHQDVPGLIDELIYYVQGNQDRLDPIILAGVFHKQFVIIHPFIDGNGRTTRLATKALLAHMGLNTFNLFSFENYYNKDVTRYFEKVGVLGNYYELQDSIDFTGWLEYFSGGIIDELLRVSKILEGEVASPETALKPYHEALLGHIRENGFITDRDYAQLTDRAKPTRNQDFNKLIELGLIERHGKGRSAHYKLSGGRNE